MYFQVCIVCTHSFTQDSMNIMMKSKPTIFCSDRWYVGVAYVILA